MFKMKVFGNGFLLTLWLVLMPKKIVVQISDSIHQNLATWKRQLFTYSLLWSVL
jgi:hypothetical protein